MALLLDIDGLSVVFPYNYIYPEQYRYMFELKKTLDNGGVAMIEMPSGTGKTVTLLSVILAYLLKHPSTYEKLIYCSRTVGEIEKAIGELRCLYDTYKQETGKELPLLSLCLSARKNMCINESVMSVSNRKSVDGMCHKLTVPYMRNKGKESTGDVETCKFYEKFDAECDESVLPSGVYNLEDLKQVGFSHGYCPYFMARRAIKDCNILIYNYGYLLNPKISEIISNNLPGNSIVVFDEAHNIDGVCIEGFSVSINNKTLDRCRQSLSVLSENIKDSKMKNQSELINEYERLVQGLRQSQQSQLDSPVQSVSNDPTDGFLTSPVLPSDLLDEAIPGNIRKADHFINFMKRFVAYLANRLCVHHVVCEKPRSFLLHLWECAYIDKKPLMFCSERLRSLVFTLEMENKLDLCAPLDIIADFASLISTYEDGFCVVVEPYDSSLTDVHDPVIHLSCMDASLALAPVFKKFKTVVLTSGTLSPMEMYPKLLLFPSLGYSQVPLSLNSFGMSLTRSNLCPLVVTRGMDQVALSSKFSDRSEPAVLRNYGLLVSNMVKVVPDGVVCFFTSYRHMESTLGTWIDMGILADIQRHKLVFIETVNTAETLQALESYRKACDTGRGGCLFCVARGKISEGIDFHHHYGRAVIVLGVPYVYTESPVLKMRLEYLRDRYDIMESDFLNFDALRHTAQCLGRAIRGKTDYGIMVLADERFSKPERLKKLPNWISERLGPAHTSLSVEEAILISKMFLRQMGHPLSLEAQLGTSLLSKDHLAHPETLKNILHSIDSVS